MSHSYDHGGNVFTFARSQGIAPEQVLDFSASINPRGMPHLVRKALIAALDSLVHYPDSSHSELKLALAQYHNLTPANFTIANGSTELIYNLPVMLPGKRALIISPSFSEYVRSLTEHQWEIRHFELKPENGFTIDMDLLEQTLSAGFDLLFLCNPGNPTGTLYPEQVIEKISLLCRSAGPFFVLDEAFMDFAEESSSKQMIVQSDNALILRSMTKFFGIPGLRLGYAISNAALAERLDAMGGPWSVNSLALAAGVAALQDSEWSLESLAYVTKERQTLLKGLEQFKEFKIYPSNTNYLLVEIKGDLTSRQLREQLLPYRILIRDCANFIGLSEQFFRVAVRSDKENKRLLECLGRVITEQ